MTAATAIDPTSQDAADLRRITGMGVARRMGRVKLRTTAHRALGGYMLKQTNAGYGGRSYQTVFTAEAPFTQFRLIIRNLGAGYTIDALKYSTSNSAAVGRNPSPANWLDIKLAGVAGNVAVPAGLGTSRPSFLASDWMDATSITRNDNPSYLPVLFVRGYIASTTVLPSNYTNTSNPVTAGSLWPSEAPNSYNLGRLVQCDSQSGDFVSSNQSGFSGNTNFGMLFAEIEFRHSVPAMTVMGLGDSITQADQSTYNLLAPVHVACATVSTTSKPISPVNNGFSSQTTTNFVARLQDIIASGRKPDVLVYSVWSPNDVVSQLTSEVDTMRLNRAKVIELCADNDIFLILSTGTPRNGYTTFDAQRKAFNAETVAMPGVSVVDYDAVVSDGATNAQWKSGYSGDGLHGNDTSYPLMGAALATVLNQVAMAYFA